MIFTTSLTLSKRRDAEALVLPFWQGAKEPRPAASLEKLAALVEAPIASKDFTGKEGECLTLYSKENEKRFILIGLGKEEDVSVEGLRKSFSSVAKVCQKKKISNLNLLLPQAASLRNVTLEQCLKGICEGLLLSNYKWDHHTDKDDATVLLKHIHLIGAQPKVLPLLEEIVNVSESVYLARDLINGNADVVTPAFLAQTALVLSKKFPEIKTTIFDKKRIEKEKMGLLLAVARGSPNEPAFIIMSYMGAPRSKDHTVVIGKGVTFDTGGLNLKPTGSMETMRDDMSGAAATIGILSSAASLKLKINVTGVIAAAENAIDGLSYKPGDVYTSYAGKTVEIGNTDAEGRLTLADAISYSLRHLKPTRLIDFATLTGAMVVALGEGISGFFSNDDKLATQLTESGIRTNELLWRLPLHAPYKDQLRSDIADLKNTGGRAAGAVTAALFLEAFVEKMPWAHIDIAGTAFGSKEQNYLPKNGIGVGVRLVIDFLKNNSK